MLHYGSRVLGIKFVPLESDRTENSADLWLLNGRESPCASNVSVTTSVPRKYIIYQRPTRRRRYPFLINGMRLSTPKPSR